MFAAAAIASLIVGVTDGVSVTILVSVAVLVAVFSGFNATSVAVLVGVAASIIISTGVLVRVSVATGVSVGISTGSDSTGGSVARGGSVAIGGSVASMPPVPTRAFCGIQDVKINNKTKISVRELLRCTEFFRGMDILTIKSRPLVSRYYLQADEDDCNLAICFTD